jgi:hypothetical protein
MRVEDVIQTMSDAALRLQIKFGVVPLRQKVEIVVYDTRSLPREIQETL